MYNFISNMRNSLGSAGVESFIATLLIIIGILVIAEGVFIALSYMKIRALSRGSDFSPAKSLPKVRLAGLKEKPEEEKAAVPVSDDKLEKTAALTAAAPDTSYVSYETQPQEEQSFAAADEPETEKQEYEVATDDAADVVVFEENAEEAVDIRESISEDKYVESVEADNEKEGFTEEDDEEEFHKTVFPDMFFSSLSQDEPKSDDEEESVFTEVPVAEVAESVIASGETKVFVDDNMNVNTDMDANTGISEEASEESAKGFDSLHISEDFGKEYKDELEKLFGTSEFEKINPNIFEGSDVADMDSDDSIRGTRAKALEEFSDTVHSGTQLSDAILSGIEEHEKRTENNDDFVFQSKLDSIASLLREEDSHAEVSEGSEGETDADADIIDREAIEKQIMF